MRQVWLYCGTILALGILIATAVEPAFPVAAQPSSATRPLSVGMASCSSSGCHGASLDFVDGQTSVPIPERDFKKPTWKNASNWWVKFDPHGRAYTDLSSKLSAQIVARLSPETQTPTPAWQDARCLACHSTPQSVYQLNTDRTDLSDAAAQLRIEGVSCDACHTQVGRSTDDWKQAHTLSKYQEEAYNTLGMRRLNTLAERVTMCAGCHVGAPAEPGIPARNMNHDMIAAGHPRLNWDYATYSDALPPHWQEYDRKDRSEANKNKKRGPDWDLQSWFEGEVHSTVASLDLTADRAKGPTAGDPARPWPELAESNCFSCHHELVPDSWRQTSDGGYKAMKKRFPELKAGGNLWQPSAYSLPLQKLTAGDQVLSKKHRDFVLLMSSNSRPDPTKVQTQAAELRAALLAWASRTGPTLKQETVVNALIEASKQDYLLWDECVQIYNSTRPILLTRALGGLKPKDEIKRWNRLGDLLELPRQAGNNWNSPRLRVLDGDKIEPEFDKEFTVQPSARELMKTLFTDLAAK